MTSNQKLIMKKTTFLINIGLAFMLILVCVCSSCKKDEPEVIPVDTSATFVLLSNGNNVNTTMGNSQMIYFVSSGRVWNQLELVANSDQNKLMLTVQNFDAQNPPMGGVRTKKYYPNPDFASRIYVDNGYITDYGGTSWFVNSKLYQSTNTSDRNSFLEITACDNYAKKVSGNFRFTVKDAGNPNDSLILSGYFNNQKYVVINKKQ